MSEQISELLPCPFCGSNNIEFRRYGRKGLQLECGGCAVRMQQTVLRYSLDWLRERMIESWNKREPVRAVPISEPGERARFEQTFDAHMPAQDDDGGYQPNYWLDAAWSGWMARATNGSGSDGSG
jgi:hypothetical protein